MIDMPMSEFRRIFILFSAAFMLFSGCGSGTGQNNQVRIGYLQNDLHQLPAFVAIEKGFFEQEGLSVIVNGVFKAGPEQMSAFAAGELDIGYVGQAPATAAVLNGLADVMFLQQVNLEGSSIVVRADSGINAVGELAGKTIAIPGYATMQDFLLRKALEDHGLNVSGVTIIVLKPPEMIQALGLKNIDAFIAWEPYPTQAQIKGSGEILISSDLIWENHPCCVLIATRSFCSRNPQMVQKVIAVHRRACSYIHSHPEESKKIGVRYTGMDAETVKKAMSKIIYTPALERHKQRVFVDFLKDMQYIKQKGTQADNQTGDFFISHK